MNAKAGLLITFGCLTVCVAGCGPSPRQAGRDFKTRIDTGLQKTNVQEVFDTVDRMHHYMERLGLRDAPEFFSAWPGGTDGFKVWADEVKSRGLELNRQQSGEAHQPEKP